MADKQQVPPVAGVVMLASASLTACIPNMEWWHAQQSSMHAVKVIWSVPLEALYQFTELNFLSVGSQLPPRTLNIY